MATRPNLSLLLRAVLPFALATVGALGAGCAAPPLEDGSDSQSGALADDEVEAEVMVERMASAAPARTGVDRWRLSAVKKDGVAAPFLVAIGSKGGKDVLDIVIGQARDASTRVQVVGVDDDELEASELRKALAADVKALAELYAEKEGLTMPDVPTATTDLATRSLGILTKDAPRDPCTKERRLWDLLSTVVIFQSVATAGVCATAVLTVGGTAPLCAVAAVSTAATFASMLSTAKDLKACKASP